MHRFSRTTLLVGERAFQRLKNSHIAIVGLGAVGGYALEGLARAGIGQLTLADFDTIQVSNINRQILALDSTIGIAKVEAARNRVFDINPDCELRVIQCFADAESIHSILDTKPDVIIDAIDSLNPKVQILTQACQSESKVFSSMGAALRTDPEKIRIDDISETKGCPLARRLRKRLKSNGISSGITCVYSTEQVDFDYQPPDHYEAPGSSLADRGRARRTLGSLPTLTGIFGLFLANEVIKHLVREHSAHQ